MERKEYISPIAEVVPYSNTLMLPLSAETGTGELFTKEFDEDNFFENGEDNENDLWASERQGFGLQDWNEEE